jgi:ABC-type antimicrobial peptide transport system ATPase subunit
MYGVPRKRVDDVLQRLGFYDARNVAAGSYSKGMRRKLLIGREILHSPRVLYLDEPTADLDAHSTRLVRELAADDVTILLTTHDMEEVEQICDSQPCGCWPREPVSIGSAGSKRRSSLYGMISFGCPSFRQTPAVQIFC